MDVGGDMLRNTLSKAIPYIYIAGISFIFLCWTGWRKRDKLILLAAISGIIFCLSALINHYKIK
jgi:hypothetical protein